ncbi:TetR/AcrR family transcriptional regulator [Agromyces sp. NPDC058484]|uniref:TetR/AcrR family transcriptional regulator n=1 Tax=Agromyces sp. NPDC058484 TaxID=3346524 RepID=UPI00364D89A5
MTVDHRTHPRRRGEALDTAILEAALDELAEVGYAGLTMERVAERARTGKASIYRRWPTRMELTLDAVRHAMPDPTSPPDTGSLRGDLLALLRESAALMDGPPGEALRGLLGDALADQQRMRELRRRSHGSGVTAMTEIARRAVARAEIDPADVTPIRLEAGHSMLRQHFLFNGTPIDDDVIVAIVDEVVVPLFRPPARGPSSAG